MTRWRRLSLRARLMLLGVTGLVVGLALGAVVLLAVLGLALQRSVDAEAVRTAEDVAALVDADSLPLPIPVTGAHLVQVIDESGRVRSASIDADRLVPMLYPPELARARTGERLVVAGDRFGLAGPVRVIAVVAGPSGDRQTVLVARSMADVVRSLGLFRTVLLVIFPVLVLALAVIAWRVIGATLGPVERLRRGAEEITATGRPDHLPVPAAQDEIRHLAVTLNGMLDRLAIGRARQREFVADAAHELRSPLTNIRTQLEVAQRLGDRADWPDVADGVLADAARLSRLVDDLLLLARADETAGLVHPEPVELGALVREVAARYPGAAVRVEHAPLWTVGEPDGLRRVVGNLLDNATRYARGSVRVAASPQAGYQLVTVTDDGPGIPAQHRDRVFQRFTRLDDGRARDAGGAGLGLAIVEKLVGRHGGTVCLADAEPGLRVEVRLPAVAQ